jgi:rhodanese-related sulfurtransferase
MKKLSLILLTCTLLVLAAACSSEKPESEIEPKEKETITYTDLTQVEFKNIEANLSEDVILLDVRTDSEVAEGMIEGAIQIDYRKDNFRDEVAKLDSSKTYVVYCRSGGRSASASKIMTEELGFKHVNNLLGGYSDYSLEETED